MANPPVMIDGDEDDESFGPTPPPPKEPHPDDVIETGEAPPVEEVIKGADPPEHAPMDYIVTRTDCDLDSETEEDSVEIPPTSVLQRIMARDGSATKRESRLVLASVVGCFLVIAIVLAVGFGTGAFVSSESSDGGKTPSGNWTLPDMNDATRPGRIVKYLASVNAEGEETFSSTTSPGSFAVNWLINDDPLQLDPTTAAGKFRLEQRYALLTLWYSSRLDWVDESGWLTATDECTWFGVTCETRPVYGADRNAVVALRMDGNNVQALPLDIFMLNQMEIVSMQGNAIQGELPYTLPRMSSLIELDMEGNRLDQDLSSFNWTGLSNLEVLRLGGNQFSGKLSDTLWTLFKLEELILDNNNFSGKISNSLSDLSELRILDLSFNFFTGQLPASVTNLENLNVLRLGNNMFEATIPNEYTSMTALQEFNIEGNQLSGDVPNFGGMELSIFRIGGNDFTRGAIPAFVYDMTSLKVLGLNDMKLEGSLGSAIGNLVNLQELYLEANSFTGEVPSSLTSCSQLNVLTMQNNFFRGSMSFLPGLTSLLDVDVSRNQLTGNLPDLSDLTSLKRFQAHENQLGSVFPTSLTKLSSLGTHVLACIYWIIL